MRETETEHCNWWPVPLENYSIEPIGLLYRGWMMGCTKWNLIRRVPDYEVCPYCGKQILFVGGDCYYVHK